MQNFIDALSAARRKSILTGQPLTQQEISGLSSGYFDAAANTNARNRALAISEKNAADTLAMERYNTEQQMEMAKKAQETQMYGNILQTGATALGTDYMVSKPGESLISKGAGLIKDVGGNVLNYGADLLGMGSETIPTFTEALTPALIDATGTGGGVSIAGELGSYIPEAAGTVEAGIGGVTAEGGAELATGAATEAAGSGILGTIGQYAPYAGYYALAKAGNKIGNMIIDNNPGLKGTLLDKWNGSFAEPLAVEQYYGNELAQKGIGTESTNKAIANSLNPIGNLMGNINNSQWDGQGGALDNIGQMALAGDPITAGLLSGAQSMGIMDGSVTGSSTGDTALAVATGGLSELSWICTATAKKSYMTKEEKTQMELLREYAEKYHYGWWNSYYKHGPTLIKAITQQEINLKEFYNNIRTVLIEPVCQQKDIEKAFEIYLAITKMLFRTYMPDLAFMEE